MPFQSESQRRYMWANYPEIAEKWSKEYPNQKNLPEHKSDKAVQTRVYEQIKTQYKHVFINKGK